MKKKIIIGIAAFATTLFVLKLIKNKKSKTKTSESNPEKKDTEDNKQKEVESSEKKSVVEYANPRSLDLAKPIAVAQEFVTSPKPEIDLLNADGLDEFSNLTADDCEKYGGVVYNWGDGRKRCMKGKANGSWINRTSNTNNKGNSSNLKTNYNDCMRKQNTVWIDGNCVLKGKTGYIGTI